VAEIFQVFSTAETGTKPMIKIGYFFDCLSAATGEVNVIKHAIIATLFFILGVSASIYYNYIDYYKWDMKIHILQYLHTLEQIKQVDSYDAALLRIKRNVACKVENYVLRNNEAGLDVDQAFVDATLQQVQVSCQ
jgi:hypothetical protein